MRFPQIRTVVDRLQIISSSDELFNHVDDRLPMWSEEGDRAVTIDIVFDRSFKEPPNITLGLTGIDAAHDQNLRFWLHTTNVKSTGFTVEFTTWDDTHIARASVSWQAVGLAKIDIVKQADANMQTEANSLTKSKSAPTTAQRKKTSKI